VESMVAQASMVARILSVLGEGKVDEGGLLEVMYQVVRVGSER